MWREFLMKMRSKDTDSSQRSENCSSDSDSDETCESDYSGLSGHYSFRNQQDNSELKRFPSKVKRFSGRRFLQSHGDTESTSSVVMSSTVVDEESCNTWREKFEFTLSLIREPRYLLAETLVAEQLKLTLKQQAYRLEQILVRQTIQDHEQKSSDSLSEGATTAPTAYNHR
jgi:hypothetical protein